MYKSFVVRLWLVFRGLHYLPFIFSGISALSGTVKSIICFICSDTAHLYFHCDIKSVWPYPMSMERQFLALPGCSGFCFYEFVWEKSVCLAGLMDTKKMLALHWNPPHQLSICHWTHLFMEIPHMELSVAWRHGARPRTFNSHGHRLLKSSKNCALIRTLLIERLYTFFKLFHWCIYFLFHFYWGVGVATRCEGGCVKGVTFLTCYIYMFVFLNIIK